MDSQPVYGLPVHDVYHALETSAKGLSSDEVEQRTSLYGANILFEPPKPSPWFRLLLHTTHPMALLLLGAGAVGFLVREPVLGIVIWLLVIANAAFSFWREHRAEEAMQALHQLLPAYAHLLRDGVEIKLPAREVVPGDVLILADGDNISADARVVEEFGLRTNNSTLTGEAVPARKTADASLREGISDLERPNLIFAGTSVVSGTGRAVVFATGMDTQFGRITRLTQAVHEDPSPLQKELVRVTRVITLAAVGLGVVVFTIGAFQVYLGLGRSFLLALGIIAAVVPEGLPATLTLSLAMAAQRLAQRGVLVKKLATLETLGTVSMICTDKSGTLTQNQMTVRDVWIAGKHLSVSGVGYEPVGVFSPNVTGTASEDDLQALLTAAALCNNARLVPPSPDHPTWGSLGDQTEAALRVAAWKAGFKDEELFTRYPRIHELPFDARRKRMSTVHRPARSAEFYPQDITFVKGAPREVLQLCTHILIQGEARLLDKSLRAEILNANDEYARNALRVLALARRTLPPRSGSYSVERIERDLTFLGLMAMMDPPRPEITEAVKVCKQAGIRMVMITGDYGLTAESLTRRVGMLNTTNPRILTGADLDGMDEVELKNAMQEEVIFARMAPEHKLRLVAAYQANGEVVAVTGDGVNDAPALRKADVGISMGIIGTDVAKEASDIILTNDNFASIVSAIEEGRTVYANIRKFITYIFSSNVPEVMPFILTALLGMPLALTVRQILAIDLGTDLLPALALGTEKPEPDVMKRPPRRRNQRIVDNGLLVKAFLWLGMIEAALCYFGFLLVYFASGNAGLLKIPLLEGLPFPAILPVPAGQVAIMAVTVFHAGVVTAQIGNAFACRTEKGHSHKLGWLSNRFLLAGIAVEIAIILSLIYIPPLARVFEHVPIPPYFWIGLSLYALVLYGFDWIRKGLVRWKDRSLEQKMNGGTGL